MARGRKTGGRQKGTPNKRTIKTTIAVKEALAAAFVELGGVPALVQWGGENRTDFYKIWSRMLPTEIKSADGMPLVVKIIDLSGEDGDSSTGEN